MGMRLPPCILKSAAAAALCTLAAARCVQADIVIVQKVEGGSQSGEMTMKIHGDRARADLSPAVSTIIDAASGDVTTLMHERKTFMRISAAAAKALGERMKSASRENGDTAPTRPKLQPTGRREKIAGHDTEQFVWEFGDMKLTYWIAKDVPNAAAILAIMKKMQTGAASLASGFMPDPADLPGLPVKTEMAVGGKKSFTTTLVSVKEEAVDPAVLEVPADYRELPAPLIPSTPR